MAPETVSLNTFPADPVRVTADRWRSRWRPGGAWAPMSDRQVRLPDPVEPPVTAPDVRVALARLSPEHRAVITEMYLNRHTAVETAEILGIPVAAVTSRSYYALHALRAAAAGSRLGAPAARA
jgi:RNA polymerase sigma-70 factor, ECF subfamily